ncbi:hypothetical protein PR003_g8654 [Phytophthora rubi]|uniref:Crinkler effector protein N-terminal domain-containing protein n=1 Tax=Phytophthora rubi TaxID=129364 RepID=A0A6A3MY58_9STRA|nr:hypothetical protein PR002_g8425 [Phytophthora rubi]KAE9038121.1 hypothetical protein PR001_g8088 [Phytophthora rubi]KAE9344037.1 hypothetical protein PR003_g8654 [Phytophthora rubi]
MVKLFCAFVGVAGSALPVDIDAGQSVGDLKDAIKAKDEDGDIKCSAHKLHLFLARKDDDSWLESSTDDVKKLKKGGKTALIEALTDEDKELDGEFGLEDVLKGMPEPKTMQIHVLVVVPTEEATAPPRKRLKTLPVDLETPSSFAKRNVWSSFLAQDGRIICDRVDRPEDVRPLTLLNPIFSEFVGGCRGKIETTAEDAKFAEKVADAMKQYYPLEAPRATIFRELLQSYLGIAIHCQSDQKSQNDGSIRSVKRGLLCMNLEVKVERGEGDAGMQNIGYYVHQPEFKRYSEEYEIPALLVELEGPWLGVSAALNINGSIVHENLSPQLPLAAPNHLRQTVLLCLASLKRAVLALFDFYAQDKLRRVPDTCLPFGCTPNYVSIKREVYANGHGRIVKFVEGRYGDTVHRFCAAKGNAPPLKKCVLTCPNGIWWRVEMEKWELKSITEATNPDDARSQLKVLLGELRENNFVHGDLRPPNVCLYGSQEKVVLIDFDWAGVAGVDVYPYEMNPAINWPEGAHGGAKLDPAHDLEWLHRMFSPES